MATRKKRPTEWQRQLLRMIDDYVEETGCDEVEMNDVVRWAEDRDDWSPSLGDARKRFARELSKAARNDFITDEDGEPVRRRLAYTVKQGDRQLTFWKMIEDLSPEQMRVSAQLRRRQVRGEVLQCDRDLRYYNKHYNPGDPLQLSWNFDDDVLESWMPKDYPDEPPEDGNDQEEEES